KQQTLELLERYYEDRGSIHKDLTLDKAKKMGVEKLATRIFDKYPLLQELAEGQKQKEKELLRLTFKALKSFRAQTNVEIARISSSELKKEEKEGRGSQSGKMRFRKGKVERDRKTVSEILDDMHSRQESREPRNAASYRWVKGALAYEKEIATEKTAREFWREIAHEIGVYFVLHELGNLPGFFPRGASLGDRAVHRELDKLVLGKWRNREPPTETSYTVTLID
ncbi:MAG: hypothetical protein MI919_19280, partial [Holophagales bacterium]|nr:hypothetical protein [Holophagales bacterium]